MRLDFQIERRPALHLAITGRAVAAFGHEADRPARSRVRQRIGRVVAPLVRLAHIHVGIVAETGIAVHGLLVLHNPAELDRHLPRRIRINAHQVIAPALRSPVTRRNVTVRAILGLNKRPEVGCGKAILTAAIRELSLKRERTLHVSHHIVLRLSGQTIYSILNWL